MQTNLPASGFWSSGPEKGFVDWFRLLWECLAISRLDPAHRCNFSLGREKKQNKKSMWSAFKAALSCRSDMHSSLFGQGEDAPQQTRRHWFGLLNSYD